MPYIASKTGVVNYQRKGDPGKTGPLVYPAGEYSGTDEYVRTELTTPVVLHEGEYYVLNIEGTVKGINPKEDYAANGSSAHWVRMTKMKYAFFEVLMANFAKLGSAIFSGDYLMSQYGFNPQREVTDQYKEFTPDMKKFTPMILLNMLTGEGHLAGNNIFWDKLGTLYHKRYLYV